MREEVPRACMCVKPFVASARVAAPAKFQMFVKFLCFPQLDFRLGENDLSPSRRICLAQH